MGGTEAWTIKMGDLVQVEKEKKSRKKKEWDDTVTRREKISPLELNKWRWSEKMRTKTCCRAILVHVYIFVRRERFLLYW